MKRLTAMLVMGIVCIISATVSFEAEAADFGGCADDEGEMLTIHQIWEEGRQQEPEFRAKQEMVAAEKSLSDALQLERRPSLSIEAEADGGQRVSPGEERALGVSARGNMRGVGSWTLFDGARSWRAREQTSRWEEAQAVGALFEHEYRMEVARVFVDAQIAEARLSSLEAEAVELNELAVVVAQRVDAGVDGTYEAQRMEEAIARSERLLSEAAHRKRRAIIELSDRTGRCVRPMELEMSSGEKTLEAEEYGGSPRVEIFSRQAETLEATSESTARQDWVMVRLFGAAGLYASRAYDDLWEPEYFAGAQGVWRPDLFGIRRTRAQADMHRAQASRAQAEAEERAIRRERASFQQIQREAQDRRREFVRESELVAKRVEVASQRWQQGVGTWMEAIEARERRIDVELDRLDFEREVAHSVVDYVDRSGQIDELSGWLGWEEQE